MLNCWHKTRSWQTLGCIGLPDAAYATSRGILSFDVKFEACIALQLEHNAHRIPAWSLPWTHCGYVRKRIPVEIFAGSTQTFTTSAFVCLAPITGVQVGIGHGACRGRNRAYAAIALAATSHNLWLELLDQSSCGIHILLSLRCWCCSLKAMSWWRLVGTKFYGRTIMIVIPHGHVIRFTIIFVRLVCRLARHHHLWTIVLIVPASIRLLLLLLSLLKQPIVTQYLAHIPLVTLLDLLVVLRVSQVDVRGFDIVVCTALKALLLRCSWRAI